MTSKADVPLYQRLMTSDRPTDQAKGYFIIAKTQAWEASSLFGRLGRGGTQLDDRQRGDWQLALAVKDIARGLELLSAGLRATYVLLEEVNRKLPK